MVHPCLFVKRNDGKLEGAIVIQVDDSLGVGGQEFLSCEERAVSTLKHKPRQYLGKILVVFNGLTIRQQADGLVILNQTEKIENLSPAADQKAFASTRALAQYIGVNISPDICAPVQLIAPGNSDASPEEYKLLNKVVNFVKEAKDSLLKFVPLHLKTARLVLVSDASFANARDLRNQLGYVIALVDGENNDNILHYGSNRWKRVARSVLAAEVNGLVLGFDFLFVIRQLLFKLLGRWLRVEAFTDSKTLFNSISKDGSTTERRLQIYIFALKESYACGAFSRLGWMSGNETVADALTKENLSTGSPLWGILQTNKLEIQPLGWADVSN